MFKGGNAIPIATVTIIKMYQNSNIPIENTQCVTLDVKYFYFNSNLEECKYIFIDLIMILNELIKNFEFRILSHNRKILEQVIKGICGLKKAGILAYDDLNTFLKPHSYYPIQYTSILQ